MRGIFLFFLLFGMVSANAQDKPAYRIFDPSGKVLSYAQMIGGLDKADIILFGEIHNDAMAHWLELQVAKDLFGKSPHLTLGMEMFEADNQLILDEFLHGTIEEKHLVSEARVWENYTTDYKPLVDLFKEKNAQVIATNIPRRYASLVYRRGVQALDSLPGEVKKWMVPLPFEVDFLLPGYKNMMGGVHAVEGSSNLVTSQAIKDATMAHFILTALAVYKGKMLHINGAYHSQNHEGIGWYLKKENKELKIATIHTAEQEDITKLNVEHNGMADYIICIPADMTKTYK
jgi:uncharacterized iron-regulated protein